MNRYLDKEDEIKLVSLGNKRYYKILTLTVAWITLVLGSFVYFMLIRRRNFLDLRNYIILVLCILPFFPFNAHKILFSKSFYATVSYTVHSTQFESLKRASGIQRPERVAVLEVVYKKDNDEEFTIAYKKNNYLMEGLHYQEGDRVFFARGLKYPVKFPIQNNQEYTCPVCGKTINDGNMICTRCHLNLLKLLD